MEGKPKGCNGCYLCHKGMGFSRVEGSGVNKVMLVGEASGLEEYRDGLPFRPNGQSGSLLSKALSIIGAERSEFTITNIVRCKPPNNRLKGESYEESVVEKCKSEYLDMVVERVKPKVIVALGDIAFERLVDWDKYGIESEYRQISMLRGYVFRSVYKGIWVIGSYHPSFIRRGNPSYTRYLVDDIIKGIKVGSGEEKSFLDGERYERREYDLYPCVEDAESYAQMIEDNERLIVSYDIENPESGEDEEDRNFVGGNPTLIQFSHKRGFGIAIPWREEYLRAIRKIVKSKNRKVGHNCWNHDNLVLRANKMGLEGSRNDDTMWMFKHYHPRLELNLQKVASLFGFPFPWKHKVGSEFEYYGCCDVDAVMYILMGLVPRMKEIGIWEGYDEHVRRLKCEVLIWAESYGLDIDVKGMSKLRDRMVEKRDNLIEEASKEVSNHADVKVWSVNQTWPRGLREYVKGLWMAREMSKTGKIGLWNGEVDRDIAEKVYKGFKFRYKGKEVTGLEFGSIDGKWAWVYRERFNVLSSVQMKRYIEGKRLELPRNAKGKITTGREELRKLYEVTGDKVCGLAIEIRSLSKMINNDLVHWNREKVRCVFGFKPWQGQLNSRNPNFQNISKHTENGQEFRRNVIAGRGSKLVEFDYSGFHIITMAYCANDERYWFFGKNDMHSFFTSYLIKQPIPIDIRDEEELRDRCRWIKEKYKRIRNLKGKPTILGNQLGLGPKKLFWMNRDSIESEKEAMKLQGLLADLFPKVEKYKKEIQYLAHHRGYVIDEFGRFMPFYDVIGRNGSRGSEAMQAIASRVQSLAFGIVYEKLLEMQDKGWLGEYCFVNTIHDSVMFRPRVSLLEECIDNVRRVMESPVSRLVRHWCREGLIVNVEIEVGDNLGRYCGENIGGMRVWERERERVEGNGTMHNA